jgi:hypothetical protein
MDLPPGHILERRALANTTGGPLTLIVEPWAFELPMAPGETLVVEIEGPARWANLYVEESGLDEGYLSIWAWDGADARVLRPDGAVVVDWTGLRVPNFAEMDERRRQGEADDHTAV